LLLWGREESQNPDKPEAAFQNLIPRPLLLKHSGEGESKRRNGILKLLVFSPFTGEKAVFLRSVSCLRPGSGLKNNPALKPASSPESGISAPLDVR
jgi:hypothetical protein